MYRLTRCFIAMFSVAALSAAPSASAATFTPYTDRSAFDAVTAGRTIIDFSGLASPGDFTYYGSPGMLSVGGVSFASSGPMFVQNDGVSSRLTYQQGSPPNTLLVTLPTGTAAVGFDFEGDPMTITFAGGTSFDLGGVSFPDFEFRGFTSNAPITSFLLSSVSGNDLKFFTFGQAVPEPAAMVLLVMGCVPMLGIALARRSGRRGGVVVPLAAETASAA